MNRIIRLTVFVSGLVNGAAVWAGTEDWVSPGPSGGSIFIVTVDPQIAGIVYAVSYGGIFKSTDDGASWKATGPGPGGISVLAIDPHVSTTLYAATDADGVFRSTDGAATWKAINSGLVDTHVSSLVLDPRNPRTLYAGTVGGLFKSTDGGASWSWPWAPGLSRSVLSLVINPQTPRVLYAATYEGLFKSTNGGTSWSAINFPRFRCFGPFDPLVLDPQDPSVLLYADYCDGVFKSTDGGANWRVVNSGLPSFPVPGGGAFWVNALTFDVSNPGTVYAATQSGLYKSTDGAESWIAVNSGLGATVTNWLAIDPGNGTLYAGGGKGLIKSTDGAASWSEIYSGLNATAISSVAVDPKDPSILYANGIGNTGVYQSSDKGKTWNRWDSISVVLAIDPQTPAILYGDSPDGLLKSTDGGLNWAAGSLELPSPCLGLGFSLSSITIDPEDTSTLYAGIRNCEGTRPGGGPGGGVWKSKDGGANWALTGPIPAGGGVHNVAIDPSNSDVLYTWNGRGLFKSVDQGGNWRSVNSGFSQIKALVMDSQNPGTLYVSFGCVDINCTQTGLFKTTDGAESWTAVNSGLPTIQQNFLTIRLIGALAIDPRNTNTIYAGTSNGGVFVSTDSGANWNALNSGLTTLLVSALAVDPNDGTVYAGTSGGGLFAMSAVQQAGGTRE